VARYDGGVTPERISVEVSNRCDKACAFCYSGSNPGEETRSRHRLAAPTHAALCQALFDLDLQFYGDAGTLTPLRRATCA
jgi:hypothetical protein